MRGGDSSHSQSTFGSGEVPAYLDQYTVTVIGNTATALLNGSLAIPTSTLTLPGSLVNSHEGRLELSGNGQFISFTGYQAPLSATIPRVTDGSGTDMPPDERNEDQQAQIVQAYDGLLGNCYLQRDFAGAESVLQEAIETTPQSSDQFHFRLAEHYRLAGRPRESIAHFKRAGELSTDYKSKVERELRTMGEDTSGCLFTPMMRASR